MTPLNLTPLTRDQAKVLAAFTGLYFGQLSDMHEYVEHLLGRPVFTHEFASNELTEQIRDLAKPDFLKLLPR